MKKENLYDVIIIGGSYAGLAAGMTLGRALRKVLIIDAGSPCNKQTPYSNNFLTNDGKTPKEITTIAKQEVKMYPTVSIMEGFASVGRKTSKGFEVQIQTGQIVRSRKLVLATGIKDVMPEIAGFTESWGISVLHCPYCHGYEVRSKKTGILANGDVGFELSSLISNWTKDLTLYTNGSSSLKREQKLKLEKHSINIVEDVIFELENNKGVIKNIVFSNGAKAPVEVLYARIPFIQPSSIPQSLGCELSEEGYVKIDFAHKTTIAGVYACGDNTTRMRTVANAVSMGTSTGLMLNKELIEEEF